MTKQPMRTTGLTNRIRAICDAYESGVGKGVDCHASSKPVLATAWYGELREAFELGFDKGQEAPAPAGSLREREEQLIRSLVMEQPSPLSPLLEGEVMLG